MDKDIKWGVVEHSSPNDWLAGDLGLTKEQIPVLNKKPEDRMPLFNQGKKNKTSNSCTICNAYREYCWQTNHTFSEQELDSIIDLAYTMGYTGGGWHSYMGMNAVRKYFNKESYVLVSYTDALLGLIYKNNNAVGITYRGSDGWNIDSDDGILESLSFGPQTYAHRTSTIFYNGLNVVVDDSYAGSKGNIYQMPNLIQLVKNGYIYPTFYLWITINNTAEIGRLNKMKVDVEKRIEQSKLLLTQTKDNKYLLHLNNSISTDESKLIDIKIELKKLN